EPELGERFPHPRPFALAEVVRERADARPLDGRLERGEDGAREREVARDELRRRRWGLEHEPAVIADLGDRAGDGCEVDATEPRHAVAAPRARVLEVHARDEVTERAELCRRIQPLDGEVRGVEVTAERARLDS